MPSKDFTVKLGKHATYSQMTDGTPKIRQLRIGPLWATQHGNMVTVWWGSKLRVFHGSFMHKSA